MDPIFDSLEIGRGKASLIEGLASFLVAMTSGDYTSALETGTESFLDSWIGEFTDFIAEKEIPFLEKIFPKGASAKSIVSIDSLVNATSETIGVINVARHLGLDLFSDGKIDVPGTAIYTGSVITVLNIAGKFFGACFGGKVTEAVFTIIGSYIAEATVNCYEIETGRGIAGIAVLSGGTIGCALAFALLSNPAVWAVGLCILVGAVTAGVIVWVVEKIVVYFDDICNFIADGAVAVWDFVSDLAVDIWDAGCEFVSDAYEFVADVATTAWNGLKTGAESVYDFACDTGEWIADKTSAALEATTEVVGDAAEWVEEKVEAGVEAVGDFLSDTGDAIADVAEETWDDIKDFGSAAIDFITSW